MSYHSYSEKKKHLFQKKSFWLLVGLVIGAGIAGGAYKASVYFSSDESCMVCHVHPHVQDSWKLSIIRPK